MGGGGLASFSIFPGKAPGGGQYFLSPPVLPHSLRDASERPQHLAFSLHFPNPSRQSFPAAPSLRKRDSFFPLSPTLFLSLSLSLSLSVSLSIVSFSAFAASWTQRTESLAKNTIITIIVCAECATGYISCLFATRVPGLCAPRRRRWRQRCGGRVRYRTDAPTSLRLYTAVLYFTIVYNIQRIPGLLDAI